MKKKKIIVLFIVSLVVLIGTSMLSESFPTKNSDETNSNDELLFSGYVNINAKPQFMWRLEKDSTYTRIGTIDIVLDTGEKFRAKFIAEENWPGANLIIHKDSYPPVKGKKVNVSGMYMDDNFHWITSAKL